MSLKVVIVNVRGKVGWGHTLRAIKDSGFNVTEIVTWPRKKMVAELRKYADRHGIKVRVFKTHWEQNKEDAPDIRDKKIIQYGDAVIAIWDYKSSDIRELLAKSFAANMPTHVHLV